MSKANADIKYDPELPFAFISTANRKVARFADREIATRFGREVMVGSVVDTTPKPKIPEDAEFIYYISWSNSGAYARRVGHAANNVWETSNPISRIDEEDLLKTIGDAEVTVLVRKEET